MDVDSELQQRRGIPSLVQLCQRAAVANLDSIQSLGTDLNYTLAKPILERCTHEQLHRLEQMSPHLEADTTEIWRELCFRNHSIMANERYSLDDEPEEGDSWRDRYYVLKEAEARRIDELGSKLRNQRMEADERKKDKGLKYSDRVFVEKRPRTGWNSNPQPKTLFQKIKSDASRVQKAYNTRVIPPMPTSKNYHVLPRNSGASLPSASAASSSRVTVNTVIHHRPSVPSGSSSIHASSQTKLPIAGSSSPPPPPTDTPHKSTTVTRTQPAKTKPTASSHPISRPSVTPKKDPMASLFVPKRKVPPQRPV
ncbi:hypothetical protein CPC08DRAFT_668052 [Agrocybe pediades]|nr:hypothetical protein CPC08DRAFT_668052 [Agrocybe pediades]